jgi:hypothetical protein
MITSFSQNNTNTNWELQTKTETKAKQRKIISYEKAACKMLVKLTTG